MQNHHVQLTPFSRDFFIVSGIRQGRDEKPLKSIQSVKFMIENPTAPGTFIPVNLSAEEFDMLRKKAAEVISKPLTQEEIDDFLNDF